MGKHGSASKATSAAPAAGVEPSTQPKSGSTSKKTQGADEPTRSKSGRTVNLTNKGKKLREAVGKSSKRRNDIAKTKKKKKKKEKKASGKRARRDEESDDGGGSSPDSESSDSAQDEEEDEENEEGRKKRKRKSKDKEREPLQHKDTNVDEDSPIDTSSSSSEENEVDEIDSLGAHGDSALGTGSGDIDSDVHDGRQPVSRESSIVRQARELEEARDLEESQSVRSYSGLSFPRTSSRASSVHPSSTMDLDDDDTRSTATRSSTQCTTSTTRESAPVTANHGKSERKRSRLKDYNGKAKRVVAASTTRFKAYLCTKEPYVSGAEEFRLADMAYNDTKDTMNFNEEVDNGKRQTIMHGAANIRSAVKDKVRTWIATTYRFQHLLELDEKSTDADMEENAKRKKENEQRHVLLTKDRNYTYAVFDDKTLDRSHPFQHKFVGNVIQDQFFTNMQSPGIACEDCFNPISAEMIAMIYSMVKFCIDEWQSGVFVKGKFNSAVYKKEYEQILVDVQAFESSDDTKEIIMTLRKRLFTNACAHCGIVYKLENTVKVTTVKAADISKMAQDGLLDD